MMATQPLATAPSRRFSVRGSFDRAAGWATLAWLVLVPATGVWVGASGHDYARVVEIGLCLVCAVSVALTAPAWRPSARAGLVVTTLLILAAASTVRAPDLRMATRELTLSVGLVAVALVVARRIATDGPTALLATAGVAGGSYAALAALGLAANLASAGHLRPFDLLIGYDNGRFFNHVQTSMLPLLALATVDPAVHRGVRRLASFGLAVGLALLALSEGRATGLALFAGAVTSAFLCRGPSRPILRSFAVAGGFAAAIYLLFFKALPSGLGVPVDVLHVDGLAGTGGAASRFVLWQIAVADIRRAPWLGIGPMHFSHTWNSDVAHPHNIYLQVAEEWGVPMALLLSGLALAGLRRLRRAVISHRGDATDRTVGAGLFMTAVAIGVDGTLSGNFVMPVSQVWVAAVIGAAMGWVLRSEPGLPRPTGRIAAGWLVLRLLPLVALLWLSASVAPELGTHFLDRPDASGPSSDAGAPRFWSNGWF